MRQANRTTEQGSQKVVFDHIIARIPGGVHVKNDADFKTLVVDGVVPAGTAIKKDGDDYKVIVKPSEGSAVYTDCVGLTEYDLVADDFPLVSIVMDGVARLEALPERTREDIDAIKAVVPGIKTH